MTKDYSKEISYLEKKIKELKANGTPAIDEEQQLRQLKAGKMPDNFKMQEDNSKNEVASIFTKDKDKQKELTEKIDTQKKAVSKATQEYDKQTLEAQSERDLKKATKDAKSVVKKEGGRLSTDEKGETKELEKIDKEIEIALKNGHLPTYDLDNNLTIEDIKRVAGSMGYTDEEISNLIKNSETWSNDKHSAEFVEEVENKPKETEEATEENQTQQTEKEEVIEPTEEEIKKKKYEEEIEERITATKKEIDRYVKGAKWDSQNNSILGAILSPNSGYSGMQRIAMTLKLIGNIAGSAMLANGMSLMGDNSYFSKIGEAINYENFKPEARKEAQKLYSKWIAETAADTAANEKVLDGLPLEEDTRNKISQLGPEIAMIAQDKNKMINRFNDLGIKNSQEVANIIYNARTGFQFSSRTTGEALTAMAGAKSAFEGSQQAEIQTKKESYELNNQIFNDADQLRSKLVELQQMKIDLQNKNRGELTKTIAEYAQLYGQIGNVQSSATKSKAESWSETDSWQADARAGINFFDIIDAGASYNYSSSENESKSSSESTSNSSNTNPFYASAMKKMENKTDEWWAKEGKAIQRSALFAIDEQIKAIQARLKELNGLQNSTSVNDAIIPNGQIESVNLKDGSIVDVDDNDGAVITTNDLGNNILSFAEGELNPFEYLGYEGKKREQEYYEKLLAGETIEIKTFDEAMELLS